MFVSYTNDTLEAREIEGSGLEVNRFDVDELPGDVGNLDGLQCVGRCVIDAERPSLNHVHDGARGDGLDAGCVSVGRRDNYRSDAGLGQKVGIVD